MRFSFQPLAICGADVKIVRQPRPGGDELVGSFALEQDFARDALARFELHSAIDAAAGLPQLLHVDPDLLYRTGALCLQMETQPIGKLVFNTMIDNGDGSLGADVYREDSYGTYNHKEGGDGGNPLRHCGNL